MIDGMKMTALKNRVKKNDPEGRVSCHLKSVRIGDYTYGCSGFLEDTITGNIVYVNTDNSFDARGGLTRGQAIRHTRTNTLYRRAEHLKDYTGGYNRFPTPDGDEAVAEIIRFLMDGAPDSPKM